MKVTAMSDLHGNLPKIDRCDLVCIAGDISPLDIQRDHLQMWTWIFEEFIPWIMSLPCYKVCITPGNHDFWFNKYIDGDQHKGHKFREEIERSTNNKLSILIDDYIDWDFPYFTEMNGEEFYETYRIYGTPRCLMYGNWCYMHYDSKLTDYYENIPEDVDILICHQPPSNESKVGSYYLDYKAFDNEGNEYWDKTWNDCGSTALQEQINKVKPKYVLCGHIHDGNHEPVTLGETTYVNVSLLNDDYELHYKPFSFKIKND